MRAPKLDCFISVGGHSITLRQQDGDGDAREIILTPDEAKLMSMTLARLRDTIVGLGDSPQTIYPLQGYVTKSADDDHLLLNVAADDGSIVVLSIKVELAGALGHQHAKKAPTSSR